MEKLQREEGLNVFCSGFVYIPPCRLLQDRLSMRGDVGHEEQQKLQGSAGGFGWAQRMPLDSPVQKHKRRSSPH